MSIDNITALGARDDWLWIVDHWTDLRARLRPGGGNALNGLPASAENGHAPIDVHISDLLFEIEETTRFYARILLDETGWEPRTSHMPGLLTDVARRYGHFTADDQMGLGFCDDATELRDKVRRALERPAPPTYMGPCQESGCIGDLYVKPGHTAATCPECGRETGVLEQRHWLEAQLEDRLMTASEIVSALVVLDLPTPIGTVKSWIARKRLPQASDGLYRLADAKALAESRSTRVA